MSEVFDHIVRDLDLISTQEQLALRLLLEQKLALSNGGSIPAPTQGENDPLAGVRVKTGIVDLAERFDDYRFGRTTL